MSARTVRDVLRERLGRFVVDDDEMTRQLDLTLDELRSVLSTGEHWVTRSIPARLLAAGDVIAAKDGRLWAVTALAEDDRGDVSPELVRGDAIRTPSFDPNRPIPTLLARTDQRALDLLARELGAELVAREVA